MEPQLAVTFQCFTSFLKCNLRVIKDCNVARYRIIIFLSYNFIKDSRFNVFCCYDNKTSDTFTLKKFLTLVVLSQIFENKSFPRLSGIIFVSWSVMEMKNRGSDIEFTGCAFSRNGEFPQLEFFPGSGLQKKLPNTKEGLAGLTSVLFSANHDEYEFHCRKKCWVLLFYILRELECPIECDQLSSATTQ